MAIQGYAGSCTVDTDAVGNAKAWNIDISNETIDVSKLGGSGWKESVSGLKAWSGSITVIFDGGADAGEMGLIDGLTSGTAVALVLKTGATGSGTVEQFSGNAIVTSMPVSNDVNGILEVSFGFEGTGALTPAALA